MKTPPRDQDLKTLGQALQEVIARLPAGDTTVALGTVLGLLEQDGILLICAFLSIPFLVPITIPGSGLVLGFIITLLGGAVFMNTNPPLPGRLLRRQYPAVKLRAVLERGLVWVHRIEKVSRPRLISMTTGGVMSRINGFLLLLGGLLLVAPLPGLFPLTNTLPGWGVLFISIGMLQHDGICVMLGYIATVVTVVYFAALLALMIGGGVLVANGIAERHGWVEATVETARSFDQQAVAVKMTNGCIMEVKIVDASRLDDGKKFSAEVLKLDRLHPAAGPHPKLGDHMDISLKDVKSFKKMKKHQAATGP